MGISRAPFPDPNGSSPFHRPIGKVTVVGGTHGNEYTGVWCIQAIERQRQMSTIDRATGSGSNIFNEYPSLEINTLLGNPVAFMQNKRFVDVDLNREFSLENLSKVPPRREKAIEECDTRTEFCSVENSSHLPHEAIRARDIDALLGPKFMMQSTNNGTGSSYDDPNVDVAIDLHTTTANMGISLIIPEGDALMSAAAAYVLHECRLKYGDGGVQCLMHALPRRQDRMNLSSCSRHGFTIEVGPTPQGVLRHDCVKKTQDALHSLLNFFHLRNLEMEEQQQRWHETSENAGVVVRSPMSVNSPTLHRLMELYPGGKVPCYRSAPAVRPGELSGKISWPNDPMNPNFPLWMVHDSVQDRDFDALRVGDPLFIDLDGIVIPYDGSHGEEVYLIFVNEGGYYYESSGRGVGVAVRSQFDLQTGWFVVESDDEDGASQEIVVEETDSYE